MYIRMCCIYSMYVHICMYNTYSDHAHMYVLVRFFVSSVSKFPTVVCLVLRKRDLALTAHSKTLDQTTRG